MRLSKLRGKLKKRGGMECLCEDLRRSKCKFVIYNIEKIIRIGGFDITDHTYCND